MHSHSKLAFSSLALVATLTATLAWGGSPLGGLTQSGQASGSLFGPALSNIGNIDGTLTDPSGATYDCAGTLEPNLDDSVGWTGFSATGTIEGTLTPTSSGPGLTGVRFWGAYGMGEDGRGSFHAFLTAPSQVQGQPRVLIGSFDGRFRDASTLNPLTLFPEPGDFSGQWNLSQ